ncbi:hypothetical protein D3C72_1579970 [compost metagenome]
MHTGKEVAVDDVVGAAGNDGLLVLVAGTRFVRGDEGRADIAKICPHGLRSQHRVAAGDGPAERNGAVKPLADLLDQRKRALHACMAPGTGRHGH